MSQLRITLLGCRRSALRARQAAEQLGLELHPVDFVDLPCLGRLDTQHVLEAFVAGSDGVLVVGCYDDACEHLRGNTMAERRVEYLQDLLAEAQVESERLCMGRVSGAAPHRYRELVNRFAERVQALGPRNGRSEKGE